MRPKDGALPDSPDDMFEVLSRRLIWEKWKKKEPDTMTIE